MSVKKALCVAENLVLAVWCVTVGCRVSCDATASADIASLPCRRGLLSVGTFVKTLLHQTILKYTVV
jgi:hypothetical protein